MMDIARMSQFIIRLTLLMSLWCLPAPGHAAAQLPESELCWKNVSLDGKKTAVFCIFKDSRGIMWLGTNNGLYFYDGVATHAVGRDRLCGVQIYALVEKDDKLYIGGNNGLLVYDYRSGKVSPGKTSSPKEIRTMLLYDDNLWIGGLDGISKLNLRNNTVSSYTRGLPHKSVYSMLRDSRGIVYVGTFNGVARWDAQTKVFRKLKVRAGRSANSPLFANCLLEAEDNECIYIGGEGVLYKYYPANEHWEKVSLVRNSNIKSLSKGDDGHVLVGTDDGVFDLYNNRARHYRHDSRQEQSLADNEIWCIYADDQQNIWTGHERGFSVASGSSLIKTIKLNALVHSGEGNEIHSIYRDSKDNLWFGGTNGIIRLTDDSSPHWYRHSENAHSLSHNRIRGIHEDAEGGMWLATDGGVNRYNRHKDNFDVFHIVDCHGQHNTSWVYALAEDQNHFWVGSFLNGLHYVNKKKFGKHGGIVVSDMAANTETKSSRGLSLVNNLVNDLIRDASGNLWILLFRDNMLARYTPATGQMRRYDIYKMTGNYPAHIAIDSRGRVWCAFRGGAVVFTNNSYSIVKFPYTNGDETVLAMGSVGEGMWISTQSNVWSVDGNRLRAVLLPIPQKAYTAVYEDKVMKKIYLGGTDEILEVDNRIMGSDRDYNTIKMILNDSGDGQWNLLGIKEGAKGMRISYGGHISWVVSTLNYSPEVVQRYMYKLAKSPTDTIGGWVIMPEGINTITFSGLRMGEYHVLVKMVGMPASHVSIPLTVRPPLVLSWWAVTLYVIVIVTMICWIVWYTRRRNMRAFQEQERQAALENVERKLSFLSTISHDLKTPLSMILGPVSLMKEHAKDPESKRRLDTIYDNAVRLNNMIHRTLELQHLEDTGENLLILSVFDVVEFCKGVFEVFRENNPQKKFIFHSSHPQIRIEADAVKFESVITNLLSNACKYSDDGATISCGINRQGEHVEIVVSDDGVGISDIDQPLVFQRMFRAPSTSGLRDGTGLGLYLIKRYLELMNGNINLYSKEGQGTSFVVTLPISDNASTETRQSVSKEESGQPKVLIVEDNMQISEFIMEILKDNFTCLTAENGRSGLSIMASFVPDLVIIDEMMPVMSGLEMVRRMKQNPRLVSIPTIMLTAKSDNKTENESIKLGIDAFMTKPFLPSALLGRIHQLLNARSEIKEQVRIQAITEAELKPIEAETTNEKLLAKIARIIEDNISDPDLNVNLLCERSGIPNKQLYRLVKKYMGMPPLDYIRSVRLQKAAVLLSQHRFTVAEISYMIGFKTPSYFAKCFQKQFGVTPSMYHSDDEAVTKR
jgi:signal transduction histidine kinase/ligand-binding sensor domain-containing protein/CheY-like chemotaxis protein/AraC-like DNA-binding protein